jgi:cation transporter-like permease
MPAEHPAATLRPSRLKHVLFYASLGLAILAPNVMGFVAWKLLGVGEAVVPLCMFAGPLLSIGFTVFVWSVVELGFHPDWHEGYPIGPIWNPTIPEGWKAPVRYD